MSGKLKVIAELSDCRMFVDEDSLLVLAGAHLVCKPKAGKPVLKAGSSRDYLPIMDVDHRYSPVDDLESLLQKNTPWAIAVAYVWCRLCVISRKRVKVCQDNVVYVTKQHSGLFVDYQKLAVLSSMKAFLAAAPSWLDLFFRIHPFQRDLELANARLEISPWIGLVGDTRGFDEMEFCDLLYYHLLAPFSHKTTYLMFSRAVTVNDTHYLPQLIANELGEEHGKSAGLVLGLSQFADQLSKKLQASRYLSRLKLIAARYDFAYTKLSSTHFLHEPLIILEETVLAPCFYEQADDCLETLVQIAQISQSNRLEDLADLALPNLRAVVDTGRVLASKVWASLKELDPDLDDDSADDFLRKLEVMLM
jgi:hypothetical protein